MATIEEVRERFSHDRYAALSGAYIEEIGEYYARCSMKITPDHRNAYGAVMGGAIYTLLFWVYCAISFGSSIRMIAMSESLINNRVDGFRRVF